MVPKIYVQVCFKDLLLVVLLLYSWYFTLHSPLSFKLRYLQFIIPKSSDSNIKKPCLLFPQDILLFSMQLYFSSHVNPAWTHEAALQSQVSVMSFFRQKNYDNRKKKIRIRKSRQLLLIRSNKLCFLKFNLCLSSIDIEMFFCMPCNITCMLSLELH